MVVCKYFLEGSCRFGSSCRYEHSYTSKYTYVANQNSTPTQPSGVSDEQIYQQVSNDAKAVINGKQWLLTSYTPFKEKESFPGFANYSPEEIRLLVYEAKANNTLNQVLSQINSLNEEAKLRYQKLIAPDAQCFKIVKEIYRGEKPSGNLSPANNVFGSPSSISASSLFANTVQNQQSIFGSNNTNPNSVFGQVSPQPSNLFSGQTSPDPKSLFSQANQGSFGSPAGNSGSGLFASASQKLFGSENQNNIQQGNNVFGPAAKPPAVFGQQPVNTFGQLQQTNPGQNQPIFGQQNPNMQQTSNAFGGSPNVFSGILNQNQSGGSVFGQNPHTPQNLFAQAVAQNQNNSSQSSVFGQTQSSFSSPPTDSQNYSKIEDLSPEDLEQYKSDNFSLGFIPESPPPANLCF